MGPQAAPGHALLQGQLGVFSASLVALGHRSGQAAAQVETGTSRLAQVQGHLAGVAGVAPDAGADVGPEALHLVFKPDQTGGQLTLEGLHHPHLHGEIYLVLVAGEEAVQSAHPELGLLGDLLHAGLVEAFQVKTTTAASRTSWRWRRLAGTGSTLACTF